MARATMCNLATRHSYVVLTAMPPTHVRPPDDLWSLRALPVLSTPFDLEDSLTAVAHAATHIPSA